jgi:exopolysaccharide biosynthesis polyprenyl glycosylphosphotransferase
MTARRASKVAVDELRAGVASPRAVAASPQARWEPLLTVARVAFDAAVVVFAAVLAFILRFGVGWFEVQEAPGLNFGSHLVASLVWVVAVLGAMALNRLYDDDTLFSGGGELPRMLRSLVEGVAVVSVVVYFTQSFSVSRSWFALTALLSAAFLATERLLVRGALSRERAQGRFQRPVILVAKEVGPHLEATLSAVPEFRIVSRVAPNLLESTDRDPAMAGADLVMGAADLDDAELWRITIEAGRKGRSVFLLSPVRSVRRDRLTVREIGGRTLIKVSPPYFTGFRAVRKRAFDALVAAILLVVTLPVMAAISLAVLLTSGWPIFYGQERVGKDGKTFTMWKFRTMKRDAEKETGATWTTEEDPRRTKIGKFLRRTSLDELPQLWNVLLGHMSLVGPRPEREVFVERFGTEFDWYAYRHRIRPGITGWAQVHGHRGNTPLDPRIDADNWYIENWSLALDVKILLQTLGELVRGRNAY